MTRSLSSYSPRVTAQQTPGMVSGHNREWLQLINRPQSTQQI